MKNRKKKNFMINNDLIAEINLYISEGERSNFVNEAISEALGDYKTRKAFEAIDKLREEAKITLTDPEIFEAKRYGQK